MRKVVCLAATAAFMLAGCQNHEKANNSATATPAAPPPIWADASSKDNMTDAVTHAITAKGSDGSSSMTIACGADGDERLFFESDLYLSSGQMGEIMTRFENEEPKKEDAFLNDKVALLDSPKHIDFTKSATRALSQFEDQVFILSLRDPHDRLRVRLTAFNGESRDLDFKITGNEPAIAALEKQCGIPNDRPGQQQVGKVVKTK